MKHLLSAFFSILFLCCSCGSITVELTDSLADRAESHGKYFGTAVVYGALFNTDQPELAALYESVLDSQFNIIVPESEMKMAHMWASQDVIDFTKADKIADWAVAHGKKMRGHVLLWYRSLPGWLVTGYGDGSKTGTSIYDSDDVATMVEWYITQVLTHYKTAYPEVFIAWDVVNEVIGPNDSTIEGATYGLRPEGSDWSGANQDFWRLTLGDTYAARAFTWARAADADAKLFYNDYHNEYDNPKGTKIYDFVKTMKDAGTPIDGIGLQCHFAVDYLDMSLPGITFSMNSISSIVDRWISEGLDVQITEVDIGIKFGQATRQAKFYADLLSTTLKKPGVSAFVTWGFTDLVSWRADDKALYFDADINPKEAYNSMLDALKNW